MRLLTVSSLMVFLSLSFSPLADGQAPLRVERDLTIPNARTPWAVDTFQGRPQLVPIHHSTITLNKHTGANVAGSLAGSILYRPKLTTELHGTRSRVQLHTKTPIFYLLNEEDLDPGGEVGDSDTYTYAIVRVVVGKDKRIADSLRYTQLTGNATRGGQYVDTTVTRASDGWVRIEPKGPMEEGEYCILPIPKTKGTYSTVVFDFGIDSSAPNEIDAVAAATPNGDAKEPASR